MGKKNILTRSRKLKAQDLLHQGHLAEARDLCHRICQADRTDAEAWCLLCVIERRLGQLSAAEQAGRQAVSLAPRLPTAQLALAMALQQQGRLAQAITGYQLVTELQPEQPEPHYHLANALREHGDLLEADSHYRRALELRPDFLQALSNRGANLLALGRSEEAKQCLLHANRLQPGVPQVLCNIALALQLEGHFDEARSYCREALARAPDFLDAIVVLAELQEKSHQFDEVRQLLEKGLARDPGNLPLNLVAARLARREGRSDEAIQRLEGLRSRLPEPVQGDLLMLLGQLYDQLEDPARAFACLREGNRIMDLAMKPGQEDHKPYQARIQAIENELQSDPPEAWRALEVADAHETPIFLLGFPRSGTTLLEQILDSHPGLQAMEEKPTVGALVTRFKELTRDRTRPFGELSQSDIQDLRKTYADAVTRHIRREPERILVDKQPLNTVHAHLIWRVYPEARFILAIRHPCDVCLSCFMQNVTLNEAPETFYSLESTATAYAGVMGLWRQYVERLPLRYHRVRYEDLVADQAGEIRRLLNFLGLAWDERVLQQDKHARGRNIRTPSYHQVAQPIYQHARYRWERYADHLAPVLPILQPYIDYFGYGAIERPQQNTDIKQE